MDNLLIYFQNIKIPYEILLGIYAVLWAIFTFEAVIALLESFDIAIYELRSRLFKSGTFNIKRMPTAPELSNSTDISFFIIILGVVLGITSAILAADPLVSLVLLVCFPILGYSFYRSRSTGQNIEKRIHFTRLLRIFINDLKAFQSAQIAADNLNKHYKKLPQKEKDPTFERDLQALVEETKQNARIEEAADRLFSGDEVYKTFADVISVTTRSGPGIGIEFANDKIKATGEWKKLVNLMSSSMSAIKFAAIVLEVFLIVGIFVSIFPMSDAAIGGMGNILRNYFFGTTANKTLFTAIIIGHTVVEFCFMEFIKINNESI